MEDKDINAITEVYYIINNMADYNRKKIPRDMYIFLETYHNKNRYNELNINNDNIDEISYEGKLLLKLISSYLY